MSKTAAGLLVGLLAASSLGADEAATNSVTLKLRLPTGKAATLVLHGGAMSVATEGQNIRIELQGTASLRSATNATTGFMEVVNPVLVVKSEPAPDGLLTYVDLYASQGHHVAK